MADPFYYPRHAATRCQPFLYILPSSTSLVIFGHHAVQLVEIFVSRVLGPLEEHETALVFVDRCGAIDESTRLQLAERIRTRHKAAIEASPEVVAPEPGIGGDSDRGSIEQVDPAGPAHGAQPEPSVVSLLARAALTAAKWVVMVRKRALELDPAPRAAFAVGAAIIGLAVLRSLLRLLREIPLRPTQSFGLLIRAYCTHHFYLCLQPSVHQIAAPPLPFGGSDRASHDPDIRWRSQQRDGR